LYQLEWSDVITDIREQFPLLPRAKTEAIADRAGIKHPKAPGDECNSVMTTDFLIRTNDGKEHARTLKYAKDLEDARVIEKFEIERQFWTEKGVDWKIVTEHQVHTTLAKNVEWLHPKKQRQQLDPLTDLDVQQIDDWIWPDILDGKKALKDITNNCDQELGLAPGSALSTVRHFLANKIWQIDMLRPIEPNKPLPDVKHADSQRNAMANQQHFRVG
jgi:hypothetical protein